MFLRQSKQFGGRTPSSTPTARLLCHLEFKDFASAEARDGARTVLVLHWSAPRRSVTCRPVGLSRVTMQPHDPSTLPFAWDRRLGDDELRRILADPSDAERLPLAALLLREAPPRQVWSYLTLEQVAELLPQLGHRLGRRREFWVWFIQRWRAHGTLDRAR